jgi:hypothetical protein
MFGYFNPWSGFQFNAFAQSITQFQRKKIKFSALNRYLYDGGRGRQWFSLDSLKTFILHTYINSNPA